MIFLQMASLIMTLIVMTIMIIMIGITHDSTELRQQYDEAQLQISGYQKHIDNCTEEMCE